MPVLLAARTVVVGDIQGLDINLEKLARVRLAGSAIATYRSECGADKD